MKRAVARIGGGLVIGLILSGLVLLGGCTRPLSTKGAPAVVNGSVITAQTLAMRLEILGLFHTGVTGDPGAKEQLRDQMIEERLLIQQAERLGLTVTDEAVEAEMALFFGALDQQYGRQETAGERLQAAGLTNDAVAGFLRDYLLTQSATEWKRAEVIVSEEQALAFYEQYKGVFYTFDEESVRASHVLIPADQEEIAVEVAARARDGGEFAELSRLYSVDPVSSRVGGDLGYFTRGTMISELADAAFQVEPGAVTGPIRSKFGWHIILVTDRQEPGTIPFESAYPDVLNRMLPELQDAAFSQWLNELAQAAIIKRGPLQ